MLGRPILRKQVRDDFNWCFNKLLTASYFRLVIACIDPLPSPSQIPWPIYPCLRAVCSSSTSSFISWAVSSARAQHSGPSISSVILHTWWCKDSSAHLAFCASISTRPSDSLCSSFLICESCNYILPQLSLIICCSVEYTGYVIPVIKMKRYVFWIVRLSNIPHTLLSNLQYIVLRQSYLLW